MKRLGLKTLVYYCFTYAIGGVFLICISTILPLISRTVIELSKANITSAAAETISRFGNIAVVILFFVGILIIIFGIIGAVMKYFGIAYELGDYSLKLTHGIVSKFEISIPYKNIQDIDLNQKIDRNRRTHYSFWR